MWNVHRKRWIAACAALGVVALGGCAPTIRAPNPADVKAPAWAKSVQRMDGAQALPTSAWPQQDWWTGLASAGLDQLMPRALSPANPRLAEAVDTVQWAASISTWRAAALGPQLSGQAAITPLQFSGNSPLGALGLGNKLYDSGDVGLGFTQALDFWGKYADRLKAALGEQRAAEARLADTRRLLAAAVVNAYLRWAEAEQQLASIRRLQHLYQQRQTLIRTRRYLGLGTDLSIASLSLQIQQNTARLARWQQRAAAARFAVAELAAIAPDALPPRPVAPASAVIPTLPPHLSLDLLAHRPDVQAARALALASVQQTKAARAAFYPDISFSALLDMNSAHLATLLNPASFAYSFGPALRLPIFTSGALTGRFRGAEAQQAKAVAVYQESILQSVRQVLTALSGYRHGRQIWQAEVVGTDATREQEKLTATAQALGLSDRAALLQRQITLIHQQMTQRLAHYAALQAWAQLETALGGGYDQSRQHP
ncbi:MAG: efflux transporter outer membrane subunit [Acidithiobacillus ferrooxidans]